MRKIVLHFFFVLFAILTVQGVSAQSRKVTGQVVSGGDGLPLPGASVVIKGTQEGVATDLDGKFSISVKDDNAILVFNFTGFDPAEKKVNKSSVVNVTMKEDAALLDEVVITTGFEKVSKRTFTGAVSTISEKELKVDGMPDVSRMIEGKAAGVTVQNVSGTFGAAPKITVRGSSSIFGDTKPLWVIDGVVQEEIINVSFQDLASGNASTMLSSAVAGLNANDVSNIEILKDAAATSMYGARAMNGVVVITTKSGRRDTPMKVGYNLENTLREVPSYMNYDISNSQETMSTLREMSERGLLTGPEVAQGRYGGVYNLLYNATHKYDASLNGGTGGYAVYNNAINQNDFLRKYEYANTDWFKELFRPSIMQNHALSFSGGGKNSAYYASISYLNDPGWTIADNVSRLTANLKTTFFLNDRMTLALSANTSIRNQKAPGSFDRQADPVGGSVSRNFDINPFNYALNTSRALRPYDDFGNYEYYRQNWAPFNILDETNNNYMDLNVKDIKIQVDLDYKIAEGFKYNTTAAIRYVDSNREHTITEHSNVSNAYRADETKVVKDQNIYLYKDPSQPDAQKQVVLKEGGMLHTYDNSMTAINWKNMLTFDKMFGNAGQHEFNAVVGSELRSIDRTNKNNSNYGILFDKGYTVVTDPKLMEKLIGEGDYMFSMGEQKDRTVGFFGKATYTYDARYTISATGRTDASNQQGGDKTMWLPTWTASGKWSAKQEKFLIDNNIISDLNVRGSYGLTATAGPASNSLAIFKNLLTTGRFNPGDRETGLDIESLKNNDLTWEKQYETNLGFDLGLINNRIYLSGDVYQRKAFDLVDIVTTTGIGGEFKKLGNNADMTTKGIEANLTTRNIVGQDFKWTTNFNISYYDQKITKLADQPRVYDLVTGTGGNVVGGARNTLYSYQFTGLNKDGLPTFLMPDGVTDNMGGANFQDRQNITAYLKKEGAVEPNKTIGFTNNFQYKNWSLDVLMVASGGNVVRLDPSFSSQYNDTQNFSGTMNNRWMLAGDENLTNVPRIADAATIGVLGSNYLDRVYNTYNYSTDRVAKGDFVRIKNITLGYEFPELMKKQIGLSTFNLKMSVTNPFLLYSDKKLNGQDPEFFRVGGVSMPVTRQYTLTLNLSI